jgi:hypothetical protein
MTVAAHDQQLVRYTDSALERPLPAALRAARTEVWLAVASLREIPDSALTRPWTWIGGSEEEVRYGFYRIAESFERAGIDSTAALRSAGGVRGRAGDVIAPATAARWDLQGLLAGLDDSLLDADPGGEEWTIRQTIAHAIESQRYYGVGSAWWQDQGYAVDDPQLPSVTPETVYEGLPSEEAEGAGTAPEIRDRLDLVVDRAAERLAGLPAERLRFGCRWSGFAVDVEFRLGRWSSHLREHTVQVEKTLVMLDRRPSEVDRLTRHVLAAWGRAEESVFGMRDSASAMEPLENAAAQARTTASEVAALA